jgi:protein-disulfide isomerase
MACLNPKFHPRWIAFLPVNRRAVLQLAVAAVLAAVVVTGAILLSSDGAEPPAPAPRGEQPADPLAVYDGIPQAGIRLGEPDAPLTLVEFADLQCPFCAQYAVEAMPAIVRDYVRPGRVAYELRIRAFLGRDSVRAAGAAAYATRQDRLYEFADVFYRNQGLENSGYAGDAFIRGIAEQVRGLDPAVAVAAADDPLRFPIVRATERAAARIGSTGTPDFYVRRDGGELEPLEPQGTDPGAYAEALDAALAGS